MGYIVTGVIFIIASLAGIVLVIRWWNLHSDSWHKAGIAKMLTGCLFLFIIGIVLILKGL